MARVQVCWLLLPEAERKAPEAGWRTVAAAAVDEIVPCIGSLVEDLSLQTPRYGLRAVLDETARRAVRAALEASGFRIVEAGGEIRALEETEGP